MLGKGGVVHIHKGDAFRGQLFLGGILPLQHLLTDLLAGIDGSLLQRLRNGVTILSILLTWCLENALETADSMKSRGYGLPGRTAFSIYRLDDRDQAALWWLGALGGYILSAGFLPLVSVGLHQALTPIHAMLNDPDGATKGINYLLPILMMAGGGQVGAGLALYFKTKNAKLKKYVAESIPVGILGVGEPLMYAVTLPLVRPFVTACLGAGFGGALAALLHIGTVSQGVSGLFGLLIVVPGQQLGYVAAMLLAYAAGFVLTWFFGVDEQKINEFFGE